MMKKFILVGLILALYLTACARVKPTTPQQQETDLVKSGYTAMAEGDNAKAENLLRQALAMNHLNPYTLLNLGVVYHQTGRYDDARRTYQTLIDLKPAQKAGKTNVEGYSGKKLVDIAQINLDNLPAIEVGALDDAQYDIDGDGVANDKDQCSDTPPKAEVTATGCWTMQNLFASGKSLIQPIAHRQLDSVAEVMKSNPDLRIEIQGHTDDQGAASLNKRLSEKRAMSVMRYLVKKGIDLDRMTSVGFGPERPIASNSTSLGRTLNRRVELHPVQ